jgi:hypothetical protein
LIFIFKLYYNDAYRIEEKAAMRGLKDLAKQAQIAEISGWMHPYGWLLDPDEVCRVILDFLGKLSGSKLKS